MTVSAALNSFDVLALAGVDEVVNAEAWCRGELWVPDPMLCDYADSGVCNGRSDGDVGVWTSGVCPIASCGVAVCSYCVSV